MNVFLGCDHAGFDGKTTLKKWLEKNHSVTDLGPFNDDRCNYPDYAKAVCQKVVNQSDSIGILICGSGIGMSMAANRYKGIRAALCRSSEDALLSRQHNNANVLCLGARINSSEELQNICQSFFDGKFEGGRHTDRINLFTDLGEKL